MVKKWSLIILFLRLLDIIHGQQTPTIGATCKLGVAEVQIGGKNTQFYLKCEPNPDSPARSEGVWVVRSRSALKKHDSASKSDTNAGIAHSDLQKIQESLDQFYQKSNPNTVHQIRRKKTEGPSVCDQDFQAREGLKCNAMETCLQQSYDDPVAYLQCETVSRRWTKRYCQDGYSFSFAHQACIGQAKRNTGDAQPTNQWSVNTLDPNQGSGPYPVPDQKAVEPAINDHFPSPKGKHFNRLVSRQAVIDGVSCTYSNCNDMNPCIVGTCNNGYCCSSGSTQILNLNNNGCHGSGCGNSPSIITLCPGGGSASGTCYNNNQCGNGYRCVQNYCCPSNSGSSSRSSSVQAYMCPNGQRSSGQCYGGVCQNSGHVCYKNTNACCPVLPVCPDGTQAAGACVDNQCGTGFSCRNGLCCVANSNVPRCLDGSIAVGACIDCECGPGYTCTTANLCCPAPAQCPAGQVSIGPCVNTQCPTGYTCVGNFPNDNCCGPAPSQAMCPVIDSIGPCQYNNGPSGPGECPAGFTCDTSQNVCCPNVGRPLGPCILTDGCKCAPGAYCQQSTNQCVELIGGPTCPLDLSMGPCDPDTVPGQLTCPTGSRASSDDPTTCECCACYGGGTNVVP